MDRVVRWIDELIDVGAVDSAIIQTASLRARPRRAQIVGVIPREEFEELIRSASRIVTHGGPGTILQVLAAGRHPIVIPRDPRLGEHVDSHQLRFVPWLASRYDIVHVSTLEELRLAVSTPEAPVRGTATDDRAIRRLRAIILGDGGL